jgi:hypothetical protein
MRIPYVTKEFTQKRSPRFHDTVETGVVYSIPDGATIGLIDSFLFVDIGKAP